MVFCLHVLPWPGLAPPCILPSHTSCLTFRQILLCLRVGVVVGAFLPILSLRLSMQTLRARRAVYHGTQAAVAYRQSLCPCVLPVCHTTAHACFRPFPLLLSSGIRPPAMLSLVVIFFIYFLGVNLSAFSSSIVTLLSSSFDASRLKVSIKNLYTALRLLSPKSWRSFGRCMLLTLSVAP